MTASHRVPEAAGRNWLNHAPRLASSVKSRVVPAGPGNRPILLGPARGLHMHLDLQHDTQMCLGLYEREVQGWLTGFAAPARTLVDIGAAAGYYTLYFLARTRAERVFSFEPSPERREWLMRNLELNGLADDPRLRLLPTRVGVRGEPGTLALDDLRSEISEPCVVKLDVDGGEVAVLAGAQELMKSTRVAWLVEVHSGDLAAACAATLRQAGLNVRIVQNAWWRVLVPERRPNTQVNHWLVASR